MKKLIFSLLGLCMGMVVYAQTNTLTGTIYDVTNSAPLAGAKIELNTKITTFRDPSLKCYDKTMD